MIFFRFFVKRFFQLLIFELLNNLLMTRSANWPASLWSFTFHRQSLLKIDCWDHLNLWYYAKTGFTNWIKNEPWQNTLRKFSSWWFFWFFVKRFLQLSIFEILNNLLMMGSAHCLDIYWRVALVKASLLKNKLFEPFELLMLCENMFSKFYQIPTLWHLTFWKFSRWFFFVFL